MNYVRPWLPKTKLRFIPLVLGSALFLWTLLPYPRPPLHGRPRPGFRYPHERHPRPRPYPPPHPHTIWQERAEKVKGAFLHAYDGYLKYAASHDELLPLSNAAVDKYVALCLLVSSIYNAVKSFNGWGLSLVESLDTMWIMDLQEDFMDALPVIANMTFDLPSVRCVP